MSLLLGQEITADHVERDITLWDAARFARLCNAVAWAQSWRDVPSVPAYTERVLVADNGIDAEWLREFEVAPAGSARIRAGVNVFQYKKRASDPASRNRAFNGLRTELTGAVPEVERRTGKQLSLYVLWTNVHLTGEQSAALRAAILEGATHPVQVEVIGAAELAAMLNDLPHIRSAFFVKRTSGGQLFQDDPLTASAMLRRYASPALGSGGDTLMR
jgi:hypothetical protein